MIVGIGIPVDLEIESLTVGWVSKSEFFLPENASNFLNFLSDPYDLTTRPITGFYVRKRRDELLEETKPTENPARLSLDSERGYDSENDEQFERHNVDANVVENGPDDGDHQDTLEADYWNQEDDADWMKNVRPNEPRNLAMIRFGIYKSMAILSQR